MTDRSLDAQDKINTARAWITPGAEGHAESAFFYLETATERLRANDLEWAKREITDDLAGEEQSQ